ncbi:tetratricopeptide repeat protein 1 [Anguilla rostrata]|uniref:tetratricopeptide repeat protein 1 n=1 Tax=Anguilla rostrata TaxID=7938 RepID=UPI0030CAF46B
MGFHVCCAGRFFLAMEPGMKEETFSEVLSSLSLSEQRGGPDGGADGHAATPPDAPEQDEDSFFDCPEVLEEESASHRGGPGGDEGEGERGHGDGRDGPEDGEREEGGSEGEEWEDLGVACGVQGEEWTECGEQNAGGGGEESRAEFREEGEEDLAEHGKDDSDSELKEEAPVEFDEEYLRELEKDLSEEEKESRRQESLLLKEAGNGQFKKGEHTEAEASYTAALGVCPVCYSKERSILFSNRAAARVHLDQKEKAIADCTKVYLTVELNPDYVRAILRRRSLLEETSWTSSGGLKLFRRTAHQAREACMRLPRQIQERNEKLKEEMLGKLKDLGNMFLRPFGLSTSNFQVNQDNSSGSYSVNFVQNPNNNNR